MSKKCYVECSEGIFTFNRPVNSDELLDVAKGLLTKKMEGCPILTSTQLVRDFLCVELGKEEHELFCCLFLDNRHRLISFEKMFRGTIDGASVYPREVVKRARALTANALILAHNHPSGVPEPSEADKAITRKITDALSLVDIRVLDHLVVGEDRCVSFAERGLL